jgi:hypothetical protein
MVALVDLQQFEIGVHHRWMVRAIILQVVLDHNRGKGGSAIHECSLAKQKHLFTQYITTVIPMNWPTRSDSRQELAL